ncbi:MAG TPA: HAMP domain-containing sensor histidine kinase, partial [Candidatus Acidoferrales bacterium]|nr:HAMP domain-containing sensor histidine kinase [Candidatus Acidoferrales bacterium]
MNDGKLGGLAAMKKVALVFVVAVLAPSLVLAWLAVRSLRDQQFLLERQQSLLDQRLTDTMAQNIADFLARQQQDFTAQVESLAAGRDARILATQFDDELRRRWALAEVGFCVTTAGKILSPLPNARPAAQMFRLDNSGFLGNREPVEVYLTANNARTIGGGNAAGESSSNFGRGQANSSTLALNGTDGNSAGAVPEWQRAEPGTGPTDDRHNPPPASQFPEGAGGGGGGGAAFSSVGGTPSGAPPLTANAARGPAVAAARPGPTQAFVLDDNLADNSSGNRVNQNVNNNRNAFFIPPGSQAPGGQGPPPAGEGLMHDASKDAAVQKPLQSALNFKAAQARKVSPQSQAYEKVAKLEPEADQNNLSKEVPAQAEFRQLIGDQSSGMLARFLQNKLKLMCWHRLSTDPDLIFGAQLNLDQVVRGLRGLVQSDRSWGEEICLALLDDNARPVVLSRERFQANWKRPFVATEVGDALPHWEVAAYLVNPAQLMEAAHTAKLTLGLLIAVLVVAIGMGSLLIVRSLSAELKLARQKTDFVSNVSHELKTPLTSIRMFSELLADGRVTDPAKHRSYLHIITAEAARLTRLINNVLDFSRMERGEKKYNFQSCDLTELVRSIGETFRPHLESAGFGFHCELPAAPIPIRADADALSQIIVNLLSNAEKYSNGGKEISLQLREEQSPVPYAEIKVLDRGQGVPRGCEARIFEKFYRAHDSL